jgi:hypothetical protein
VERDALHLFLDIWDPPSAREIEFTLKTDSLRLSSEAALGFLVRMEALLVAAVEHGDRDIAGLLETAEAEVTART